MNGPWLLTKKDQYIAVYREGKAYVSQFVVMKIIPNKRDISRYGFSVSKSVGKAVIRNLVKRRLREICRLQEVSPGWDIVIIARRGSCTVQYRQLKDAVIFLLDKAGLLNKNSETNSTNFD